MAADGSLTFITKVDTKGFEDGTSSLKAAVEKLTLTIERLSDNIVQSFNNVGKAAENAGAQAQQSAEGVDKIAESAKKAQKETKALEKQMEAITVTHHETGSPETEEPQKPRTAEMTGEYKEYGKEVEQFVEDYAKGMGKAERYTNEFKQEIETLSKALKDMEGRGLYFGDDEYDETYVKLAKVKQALADYKKEMLSPTPDVEIHVELDMNSFEGQKQKLKEEIAELEKRGITLGNEEYDKTYMALERVMRAEREYKNSLLEADQGQKKAEKSAKKMASSMDKAGKSAKSSGKSMKLFGMLGKSILFSFVFKAISAASAAVKEGFQNLAQYSDKANKNISSLMSAGVRLKNSFAAVAEPMLDIMAPALRELINLASQAVTWFGQLMAALSGRSVFVKAVDIEEDYAASLDQTNKELKEQEKEAKKLAFTFDDLIQAQGGSAADTYTPPTPDEMFETVELEDNIKKFAEAVKNVLAGLFDPIRKSWEANGPMVMESLRNVFSAMKQLAADVGASFMQVWNVEGYGEKITDDLLAAFANLAQAVANLINQFDKAWKSGDTGTSIIRHLGDIILVFTGFLRDASESIKNWAADLDFSPLLKSFDGVLVAIRPIVSKVGDVLLFLLNNVLLPLAKWGIENAIPAAFDLISAALKALDSILDALKPLAMWLWNEFLKPLGEWTGKVIIEALKTTTGWLTKFSDWINQHEEDIEFAAVAVAGFFAAWKAMELIEKVKKIIDVLSGADGFLGVLKLLNKNLDASSLACMGIATAIGILIAAVYEIYKNWNNMSVPEKVITSILAAASAAMILAVALGAIGGAAGALLIAGAIAAGIAAAAIAMNAGKRAVTSSGANASGHGGLRAAYNTGAMGAYRVPHLASGTVVPPRAGEFAAILGDNNRETEVVSPLSTIEQALDNVMQKYMGTGGNNRPLQIDLYIDRQRFARAVYEANGQEKQRVGVKLVTEGSV